MSLSLKSRQLPYRLARRFILGMSFLAVASVGSTAEPQAAEVENVSADLLIVGGTESACAAAVQAARMGVQKIVLINDIEWLGGQFSAEALVAIDENRGPEGYSAAETPAPFPRSGAFKEITDRIEALNHKKYGRGRPGNTRVSTTTRPAEAAEIFRNWLAPYVRSGQISIRSWYEPVHVESANGRVTSVLFESRRDAPSLRVAAQITIDASDWGDVIRQSGAKYEFGPDLREKYGEPLAPERREGYPVTDMNPITYCMVIVETDNYEPIPRPHGYDPRNYRTHHWPKDPLWLYGTRRLVDHYKFADIDHPDVLLLCFPAFDYPVDVYPQQVADALESSERGAAQKNIAELSPEQRRIVFEDAKQYSLGFLYYLQTEVHDGMPDKTHSFRRFRLSDEFATADKMPPKPYVRESLRMKAMYMMRQQDTTGVGGNATRFAKAMYHDGVAAWQFEYDFHPTKREFLSEDAPGGPWRCGFREGRRWGPPYSGRSTFPLRSLIPETTDGLLGAQKNLGYSSIVSSAVRLHDQSMAIGQAAGACAAVCLRRQIQPREIPFDRSKLLELQTAIASKLDGGEPATLWPFRDLSPSHSAFTAVNLLAIQRCLPIFADEIDFRADAPASKEWIEDVVRLTDAQLQPNSINLDPPTDAQTRGEFAIRWWRQIQRATWRPFPRVAASDADGDGIADRDDALPLDPENASLPLVAVPPDEDGVPGPLPSGWKLVEQFNFAGRDSQPVASYRTDNGSPFDPDRGYGWKRDISASHRRRGKSQLASDTFLFTRSHDVWQYAAPNGTYRVEVSVGDAAHEQIGQNVTIEGVSVFRDLTTAPGRFAEKSVEIEIQDGRLTVEIGRPDSQTNTCLNWLRIAQPAEQ